jgi:membrane-associated protease RseP (regulator of RpoE activity)
MGLTILVLLLAAASFLFGRWAVLRRVGPRSPSDLLQPAPDLWAAMSRRRRWVFVAAGPLACWAFCSVLHAVALLAWGEIAYGTRVDVTDDGPAAHGGVLDGDRVISVAGRTVTRFEDIRPALEASTAPVEIVVEREGRTVTVAVTPEAGRIGVRSLPTRQPVPVANALGRALAMPPVTLTASAAATARFLSGADARGELSGPVGMVREMSARGEPDTGTLVLEASVRAVTVLGLAVLVSLILAAARVRTGRD